MAHAEICPVCKGTGKYQENPFPPNSSTATMKQLCHGCGGRGWVTVGTEYPTEHPKSKDTSPYKVDPDVGRWKIGRKIGPDIIMDDTKLRLMANQFLYG